MNITYRGYDIERSDKTDMWYQISLNGEVVQRQHSEEAAYNWIDNQKKKQNHQKS